MPYCFSLDWKIHVFPGVNWRKKEILRILCGENKAHQFFLTFAGVQFENIFFFFSEPPPKKYPLDSILKRSRRKRISWISFSLFFIFNNVIKRTQEKYRRENGFNLNQRRIYEVKTKKKKERKKGKKLISRITYFVAYYSLLFFYPDRCYGRRRKLRHFHFAPSCWKERWLGQQGIRYELIFHVREFCQF